MLSKEKSAVPVGRALLVSPMCIEDKTSFLLRLCYGHRHEVCLLRKQSPLKLKQESVPSALLCANQSMKLGFVSIQQRMLHTMLLRQTENAQAQGSKLLQICVIFLGHLTHRIGVTFLEICRSSDECH